MPRPTSERGAVVAETAVALPFLLTLLLAGIWCTGLVVTKIQSIDVSRDVARALARGDSPTQVESLIRQISPPNTTVTYRTTPTIQVTVEATPRAFAPFLPAPTQTTQATLHPEPTQPARR